jgi:CTP:phosphocholine cytidylyltransferase-like protein
MSLELENRDGGLLLCEDEDNNCYLVLEADTFLNKEVFKDLGSTEHIAISREAFDALSS